MSNYTQLYWLTRLDNFNSLFTTLLTLGIFLFIGYHLVSILSVSFQYDKEDKEIARIAAKKKRWIGYMGLCFIIVGTIGSIFLPTRNEMIIIYAGEKTMDYVQKDTSLSKIPYQSTKIISDYLENILKEQKSK